MKLFDIVESVELGEVLPPSQPSQPVEVLPPGQPPGQPVEVLPPGQPVESFPMLPIVGRSPTIDLLQEPEDTQLQNLSTSGALHISG